MRLVLAACAVLAVSTPALAAEPTVDPAPASVPITDPARLAAARHTVDYVFPSGTYARMMNGSMDKMMDSLMDSMMRMPVKDLAGMAGVDTSKLSTASLEQIMEIYDPAFKERMKIISRTTMEQMFGMMSEVEPDIRDGLAEAYAARYTTTQLGEMNAFFATPTGKEFAANAYLIMMSPEVMAKMQGMAPKLMKMMPTLQEKAKAAMADLPPERTYADLTKAEKARLAEILGISQAELDKSEKSKAAKPK